jgi:serine/threonine protein phosphatase PrpC
MVDESVIVSVLESGAAPNDQCRRIIDLAMEAGGDDDATALVAEFQVAP